MKFLLVTTFLWCALMFQGNALYAQGIYVTPGANGPSFSDKPQSGAKEVTLRPLTVVPKEPTPSSSETAGVAPVPARGGDPRGRAVTPAYRSFAIIFPEYDGSVVINTGMFDVRLAVDPPLLLGEGHAFVVSINGRPVEQRFTSTEFTIPPEFWGGSSPPINQSAQLDASLIDGYGRVLMSAAPVRFFMRYTTILNNPNRRQPFSTIQPITPKPQPKPTVENTSSTWPMVGKTGK